MIAHDWGTIVGWAILQRSLVHIDQLISVCGGTEFPSSDVYSKLRFGNSPHYITSFQDPLNISHLVDNKIDMFIRSAYRDTQALPIQEPNLSMNAIFMSKNVSNSVLDKSVLDNYLNHFKNSSLFQPICWYSNIDKNIDLSNTWRKEVNTPVTFIFGKIDYTVQLNDKMINRLMSSGSNILIREVENAGHWLPLTHKESVLEHI